MEKLNNLQKIFMQGGQSKHLVIVHGYLFEGSGSNVYVQNIAESWKKMGHRVTVLCQDRNAEKHPIVDQFVTGTPDEKMKPLKGGQLRIIVPDINNLLPVYIWNEYQGYTVKQIQNMSEEQIEAYINMNADCLKALMKIEKIDKVLTNHAILSPIVAQRALEGTNVPYDIKVHGSAITYTIRPNIHLLKYALPAFKNANRIYTGTLYVKNIVEEVFKDHAQEIGLSKKLEILPPGMNPQKFNIAESLQTSEKQFLALAADKIKNNAPGCKSNVIDFDENITPEDLNTLLVEQSKKYNQRVIDFDTKQRWVPFKKDDSIILFIGAFLASKGVGELLAIAPSLIKKNPNLRFVLCGFGTYREHMNQLIHCFESGNLAKAEKICQAGNFVSEVNIKDFFFKADKEIIRRITVLGFVEHSILGKVLPLCSICVVPSKAAEAFGMVTVQSMAAGVLPICNNHSGLADVLDIIQKSYPQLVEKTRVSKEDFFKKLPQLIIDLLEYRTSNKLGVEGLKKKVRQISVDNFSWDKIALKLIG